MLLSGVQQSGHLLVENKNPDPGDGIGTLASQLNQVVSQVLFVNAIALADREGR